MGAVKDLFESSYVNELEDASCSQAFEIDTLRLLVETYQKAHKQATSEMKFLLAQLPEEYHKIVIASIKTLKFNG